VHRRSTRGPTAICSDRLPPEHHRLNGLIRVLLLLTIAWGAFAFGAVYPWAYWPLFIAIVVIAVLGLCVPGRGNPLRTRALFASFGLFAALAAVQLIPVPIEWLGTLSPNTVDAVNVLDPLVANGLRDTHPLSIAPPATAVAVAGLVAMMLLVAGLARWLSVSSARRLAEGIVLVGVALAMTGIVQRPFYSGRIYGFWRPAMGGNPFGPFVNKNHFAGWMLMALPLAFGLICSRIVHARIREDATFRDRVVWLGSDDAGRLLLLCGAAALMTLALLLTMARSGIAALILALLMTCAFVLRGRLTVRKRLIAVAVLGSLCVAAGSWLGASAIASAFSNADWSGFNGRLGPWIDGGGVVRRFPLTGTGLNTYSVAMNLYQAFDLDRHYAQAHNDYLQLAAEGGALLCFPALLSATLFLISAHRRLRDETSVTTYWIRVGAIAGIAAIALQETVEFSLQMPGNALMFAVLCAIVLHRTPRHRVGLHDPSGAL
jgi:O-antigen ligase